MIRYRTIRDSKLSIFKNMFINNGTVNAYYVLYPYNYGVMDLSSAERHVNRLYKTLSNLHSALGEVKLSMFKLNNIVSKEETIASIIRTVQMYNPEYKDVPEHYKGHIKSATRDYAILAVNIDVKNSFDIETQNLKSIIKGVIDNFVRENFSTKIANVDEEAIAHQNVRIRNTLARYAEPANERLVMNIYVNSLFPSYNLVYNDYIVKNANAILSGIKQDIIPKLGWFEMSNSGIVGFGGIPRTTYGSVLTILEFPDEVKSENFNISTPGLHVNMKLLEKDKSTLKFRRMRADANQELEEAEMAKAKDTDIGDTVLTVQSAIDDVRNGRIATEVDANILVIADTKEELDKRKKHIISVLSDVNVVCSIAENQAKAFINSFVKCKPSSYHHIMDLEYALSFQLDSGTLIGDQDSRFSSPVVGIS